MARVVLVIAEAKYWGDLKSGLARAGVEFLGFDKKKPSRREIDRLVAKADFIVMRNVNVAHHSVTFAKEAAKRTDKPFWVSHNFGLATILAKLSENFPDEDFSLPEKSAKKQAEKSLHKLQNKTKQSHKNRQGLPSHSEAQKYVTGTVTKNVKKSGSESMREALKDIQLDDSDIDFAKMFGK